MSTDHPIPPVRDLPRQRLRERKEHLLAEIASEPARRRADGVISCDPPARNVSWRVGLATLAAFAALAALFLVSPWETPSLTDRALAALGDGPVLHIVTTQPSHQDGSLVDIETGQVVHETRETELWFDEGRGLKRTVTRINGVVVDEMLETPAGGFTRGGRIITCAWIAAHPVEATKLRVSCNADMKNGTTPRHIPEPLPTLDPALAGFADGYQEALASGRAEEIGRDTIDGREVIWLRFRYPPTPGPASGRVFTQDVAVDSSTYRPVRLRIASPPSDVAVAVAETLPFRASLFRHPEKAVPGPSSNHGRGETPIDLAAAAAVLERAPLWLGNEWNGLRLVGVAKKDRVIGYGPLSGIEPTFGSAIELKYAAVTGGNGDRPTLAIIQAASCEFVIGWACGDEGLDPSRLREGPFPMHSIARTHGLYVSIWSRIPRLDALDIVRALEPVP